MLGGGEGGGENFPLLLLASTKSISLLWKSIQTQQKDEAEAEEEEEEEEEEVEEAKEKDDDDDDDDDDEDDDDDDDDDEEEEEEEEEHLPHGRQSSRRWKSQNLRGKKSEKADQFSR